MGAKSALAPFVRQVDFIHHDHAQRYALMPPTGSPDRHGVGTSVRRCMPHGFVILTAKPIAGHDAKGPAAGTRPGRSRCRRRRTWIRTGDRRQPRIIGVPRTRQTAMPENAAAEPTATAQAATAQQ